MSFGGQKIAWLEALFFFLAGNQIGGAINSAGIPQWLVSLPGRAGPMFQQLFNNAGTAGTGNGQALAKLSGIGTFAKSMYDAGQGRLTKGDVNAYLPYSIGAFLDDPETDMGSGGPATSAGRWSS